MDGSILEKSVLDNIKENYEHIFSAEKKVADCILGDPQKAVDSNVSELAKLSGVSDATVVRMCNHVGYKGYYQLRITLARDLGRQQYSGSVITESRYELEVDKVFIEYADDMLSIAKRIDKETMRNCVELIKKCKQAHILAVGNTSPLAQYMGFRLGRLGIKCTYNIAPEYFINHLNLADAGDILITISQSGTSKQVVQGMELGKSKGLKSIAITAFAQSPVSYMADYVLLTSGKKETFNYYKSYARLNEMAVIDALLTFLTNDEIIKMTKGDNLEILLSEYKI